FRERGIPSRRQRPPATQLGGLALVSGLALALFLWTFPCSSIAQPTPNRFAPQTRCLDRQCILLFASLFGCNLLEVEYTRTISLQNGAGNSGRRGRSGSTVTDRDLQLLYQHQASEEGPWPP